jgi:hypothetical protein
MPRCKYRLHVKYIRADIAKSMYLPSRHDNRFILGQGRSSMPKPDLNLTTYHRQHFLYRVCMQWRTSSRGTPLFEDAKRLRACQFGNTHSRDNSVPSFLLCPCFVNNGIHRRYPGRRRNCSTSVRKGNLNTEKSRKPECPQLCRFLGRLHDEPLDALRRQASDKPAHQQTSSPIDSRFRF